MKRIKFGKSGMHPAIMLSSILLGVAGCATYHEVESESVTKALDFHKADKFQIEVADTSVIDTAFSKELRDGASKTLIDELESEGFDYVGAKNPDLTISFATYVASKSGYINTSLPVVNRIVETDTVPGPVGSTSTQTRETITTSKTSEPIYVSGPSRLFILDVMDATTKVLLWRAYTLEKSTGLDKETLYAAINRLVESLDNET